MKDETFDYIWEQIVVKQIDKMYADIDESVREKYELERVSLKELRTKVVSDYDDIRVELKRYYYDVGKERKDSKNRIDRHKIAACIAYSMIRNKAFRFIVRAEMPKELFVINYRLAYSVSLGVVYTLLLAQYIGSGQNEYANLLKEQKKLIVPQTSCGHDEYNIGRIYTLALNDIYGNTFDVLTYSDMMFWIEYYNRQLIEKDVNPKNYW